MKKTLIVSALAVAFAGVAHAESSVTLYGIVDAGVGYSMSKTTNYDTGDSVRTSKVGAQQNVMKSNRWGLKGSEDLGNGTSAIFQLESGFTIADGKSTQDGRLFGRRAIIGLTGESWGTFTIGRDYNAGDAFLAPIDPFGTNFSYASSYSTFGLVISGRGDAVVKYVTPNLGGFQMGVGYISSQTSGSIWSETKNDSDGTDNKYKNGGVSVGLGYTAGPLYIGAGYDYFYNRDHNETLGDDGRIKETDTNTNASLWNIGATYDFDVVKLHLMYGQQIGGVGPYGGRNDDGSYKGYVFNALDEVNGHDLMSDGGLRGQAWLVGISAPLGDSGKVMFSYQGDYLKNDRLIEGSAYKNKGHMFGIAFTESLSKRTTLYATAAYGWSRNYLNDDRYSKTQVADVIVGLNHSF